MLYVRLYIVEPRLMVTSLLRPIFFPVPEKRPYIFLKEKKNVSAVTC